MTPEQRARKVTRQWAKDSHQYKHKKMGIKHYIAEAIKKTAKETRAKTIRELDAKYGAYCEKKVREALSLSRERELSAKELNEAALGAIVILMGSKTKREVLLKLVGAVEKFEKAWYPIQCATVHGVKAIEPSQPSGKSTHRNTPKA